MSTRKFGHDGSHSRPKREFPIGSRPPHIKNQLAKETIEIIDLGVYKNLKGEMVNVKELIDYSVDNSKLYIPNCKFSIPEPTRKGIIEVTEERSLAASQRLVVDEKMKTATLNFASARNPGGGFWGMAKAQEESLARSSALYQTQIAHPQMYQHNRSEKSLLYSDYMIYSPSCPVWRGENGMLLDNPYVVDFITAPAVNCTAVGRGEAELVNPTMFERIRRIICVAAENEACGLVLGAYGCGVFKNDPADVAEMFRVILIDQGMAAHFDKIVFPVDGPKHEIFKKTFGL